MKMSDHPQNTTESAEELWSMCHFLIKVSYWVVALCFVLLNHCTTRSNHGAVVFFFKVVPRLFCQKQNWLNFSEACLIYSSVPRTNLKAITICKLEITMVSWTFLSKSSYKEISYLTSVWNWVCGSYTETNHVLLL